MAGPRSPIHITFSALFYKQTHKGIFKREYSIELIKSKRAASIFGVTPPPKEATNPLFHFFLKTFPNASTATNAVCICVCLRVSCVCLCVYVCVCECMRISQMLWILECYGCLNTLRLFYILGCSCYLCSGYSPPPPISFILFIIPFHTNICIVMQTIFQTILSLQVPLTVTIGTARELLR